MKDHLLHQARTGGATADCPEVVDDNFQHLPLDLGAGQIRLLKLLPSSTRGDPIRCEVFQANLDTSPPPRFQALSYTWGPPVPVSTIYINGRRFDVRENLYNFLLQARSHSGAEDELPLWIDQICIDQDRLQEKSHQVAQMSRVYNEAEHVLIWLGLGDAKSDACMESLGYINRQDTLTYYEQQRRMKLPAYDDALNYISSNHYWTRLWIVQEVFLAKVLTIWWGKKTLPWDCLNDVYRFSSGGTSPGDIPETAMRLALARSNDLSNGTYRMSWYWALFYSANTYCAEPRDRIYGVPGLVREQLRIPPNYNKDMVEIVVEVIERIYKNMEINEGRLDVPQSTMIKQFASVIALLQGKDEIPISAGSPPGIIAALESKHKNLANDKDWLDLVKNRSDL